MEIKNATLEYIDFVFSPGRKFSILLYLLLTWLKGRGCGRIIVLFFFFIDMTFVNFIRLLNCCHSFQWHRESHAVQSAGRKQNQ